MIKKIKLFPNDNEKSKELAKLIESKLIENEFLISDDSFDLAIAVGGDGSFLRMIKENNYNSDIYYIGINSGTLGFLQEVKIDEVDNFINELKTNKFKVEEIKVQQTTINTKDNSYQYYSLNEIIIRDNDLKVVKLEIKIDNSLLENYMGDGILISTSTGSTAHNLSYKGSIVYNTFSSLQITPMGPINSKVYKSLVNSVIIPEGKEIKLSTVIDKSLLLTIDGENIYFDNVDNITTKIDDKKLKFIRLSHYNFPEKINEKLLTD